MATLPSLVLLTIGLFLPVGVFFFFSFWEARLFRLSRNWSIDRYSEVVSDQLYRGVIYDTLALAFFVATIVVFLAYICAYAMRFSVGPMRRILILFVVAPALASYLVRIYAWKTILSPNGVLNWLLMTMGLTDQPADLLGSLGLTVTFVHILFPIAFLPIYANLEAVNRDVIWAARDAGAGPIQTFVYVTLPLTKRSIVTAFLLVFILTAGDYVTPQLIGGRGSLMVGRVIYDQFGITGNFPLASALSFSLILAAVIFLALLFFVYRVLAALTSLVISPMISSLRFTPTPRLLGSIPWGKLLVGLMLLYLYFPLLLVAILSFNDLPIASFPFRGFTLKWYHEIFSDDVIRRSFVTSIQVACLVSILSVLIAVPGAFAVTRRHFVSKPAYLASVVLPISLPGVVIGFSILAVIRFLDWRPSLVSVVLGQTLYAFPFVLLIMTTALHDFNRTVEEAGRDLGCTYWGMLYRVMLPILLPVMLGASIIVFAISMDEFVITNFLVGSEPTLPTVIWSIMNRRGIPPTVNAVATILVAISLLFVISVAVYTLKSTNKRARVIRNWED